MGEPRTPLVRFLESIYVEKEFELRHYLRGTTHPVRQERLSGSYRLPRNRVTQMLEEVFFVRRTKAHLSVVVLPG